MNPLQQEIQTKLKELFRVGFEKAKPLKMQRALLTPQKRGEVKFEFQSTLGTERESRKLRNVIWEEIKRSQKSS